MLPLAGWGLHQARKLVPHRMGRLGDTCLCAMWHFWGRPLTVGSGRGRGGLVHHPGARWHGVPTASTWLSGPLPLFPSLNFALHQICHFFFQFSIQEESSWKEGSSAALMANCTLTTPSTYFLPLKPMGAFHILLIVTRAVFPPGSCRWPFLPRGK